MCGNALSFNQLIEVQHLKHVQIKHVAIQVLGSYWQPGDVHVYCNGLVNDIRQE